MGIGFLLPDNKAALLKALKSQTWYRVREDDGTTFLIRLRRTENNRLICTGLMVGVETPEDEVTARSLREVKLGAAMGQWVQWQSHADEPGFDPHYLIERMRHDFALAISAPITARPARPGPKGLSDSHFRDIADDYRQALIDHPRRPVKAVAEAWDREEVTVRRWIKIARERGYLNQGSPESGAPTKATKPRSKGTK